MNKPFYRIEYLCTSYDAFWLYRCGGIKGWIDSDNAWNFDEDNVFETEEEARKAWDKNDYSESYIWDREDFCDLDDEPEVGITMYTLSKYDENMHEEVLEWSSTIVTPEDIQAMYPDIDFENAEA